MTVSELIESLKDFDQDDEVLMWNEFGNIEIKIIHAEIEGVVLS